MNSTVHQPLFRSRPSNKNENNEQEATKILNSVVNQDNINHAPVIKSKSNIEGSSSSHSMLFDRDEEEEDESENILDDSEIRP